MKKLADTIGNYGETAIMECPHCNKNTKMKVLRASNGIGAFGVSLFNYNHDLFVICPECDALFGVDKAVAKEEAKSNFSNFVDVKASDLTFQQVLPLK